MTGGIKQIDHTRHSGTVFKQSLSNKHYERMDVVIFFEAIGNLLFAAILFTAVVMATCLFIFTQLIKQLGEKLAVMYLSNHKLLMRRINYKIHTFRKLASDAIKIRADYSHQ